MIMRNKRKGFKENFSRLGKCPNCGVLLKNDSYGTLPLKDDKSELGTVEESLVICKNCLADFDNLSPEIIGESLKASELKWEVEDINLAISVVQAYKDAKTSIS